MKSLQLALLAVVTGALAVACPIPQDDLLPGIGAPCTVSEGLCSLDLTCRPDEPGASTGLCAPVLDYGACPKPEALPGRFGTVATGDITLDEAADKTKLDDVRVIEGQLRVSTPARELDIGGLCNFRALQRVGDGFLLGNTDVTTLDGLQSLTSVKNGIAVFGNGDLTSLDGLANLMEIEPCTSGTRSLQVVIARNDALTRSTIDEFVQNLETRFGKAPQVIRCENGPSNDADPDCTANDALKINGLQDGGAFCE